ncbi:hypothetical protein C0J50_4262 [Silurus asotus]|uniref:Uncharacterized protein n=1 Tax=Silurus asotus TaxID=30991 RepID=A0AAD5AAU4_SILAS|nr:hypothetical protein C0J50_4262 [Silurus asotus]
MARQRAGGVVKEGRGRGAAGTGNATGTSAGVNGDPRVTRILAHTEHEPPAPGPAPSDPETTHESTDLRAGAQDSGVMRERPHLPREQMLAERAQNAVYCRDVPMPTPFHLSVPPYANAYPHSAFLLSVGAPPLGFPPVPPAALLESRQMSPERAEVCFRSMLSRKMMRFKKQSNKKIRIDEMTQSVNPTNTKQKHILI